MFLINRKNNLHFGEYTVAIFYNDTMILDYWQLSQ